MANFITVNEAVIGGQVIPSVGQPVPALVGLNTNPFACFDI